MTQKILSGILAISALAFCFFALRPIIETFLPSAPREATLSIAGGLVGIATFAAIRELRKRMG